MILRLFGLLDVPLRDQNEALMATGFEAHFAAPPLAAIDDAVEHALGRMLARHEPYPMVVVDEDTTILRSNAAARRLFAAFVAEPSHLPEPLDMVSLLFDPRLVRPFVLQWELVAQTMMARFHREALHSRSSTRAHAVLERMASYPDVQRTWQTPDVSVSVDPTFTLRLQRGSVQLGFLIAVTTFSAPRQVTLEELRIESCFPLDAETERHCELTARGSTAGTGPATPARS